MSTVAIIAATSAANSAAAVAASRAQDAECRTAIGVFHAETATQAQQLHYAACVQRFAPASGSDVALAKAAILGVILFVLIGAMVGIVIDRREGGGMPILAAVGSAGLGLAAFVVLALTVTGIAFVVTA